MYGKVKRDDEYISGLMGFIGREYGLAITGIAQAKRGYYGETWRLKTADCDYFMKLDYSKPHKETYARSFFVMEHLRCHGADFISRIVKTVGGKLSARYDGAVVGIFEWIDGENIQNERTKAAEYQMLAKVYTIPAEDTPLPREDFAGSSADVFFEQWGRADDAEILALLESNRGKLERRAARLRYFASLCRSDVSGFVITHGDAGGNVIVSGDSFFIVDWDNPVLAPPERDAWFCLHWDWAMDSFNRALRQNGICYSLRTERLAYYCYDSFFFYLTEYMNTFFDIGNDNGSMAAALAEYFDYWIEEEIAYADEFMG